MARFLLVGAIGCLLLLTAAAASEDRSGKLSPAEEELAEALVGGVGKLQELFGGAEQRPPGVLFGEKREWRVLWEKPDTDGRFWVGNFDQDPDTELLLDSGRDTDLALLNLDSTHAVQGLPTEIWPHFDALYDYDGDGLDDPLMSNTFGPVAPHYGDGTPDQVDRMYAVGLDGYLKGPVHGLPMGPRIVYGDFDGDGSADLLTQEEGDYGYKSGVKLSVVGKQGEVLFQVGEEWWDSVAGDVDGDGRDELISKLDDYSGGIRCVGLDQQVVVRHATNRSDLLHRPAYCADLNGDGIDEVVTGTGQVFDPAARRVWKLQVPPGHLIVMMIGSFGDSVVSIANEGVAELAGLLIRNPTDPALPSDTMAIWSAEGKLVYAERFPGRPLSLRVGTFGGKQHLLLESRKAVFIWP